MAINPTLSVALKLMHKASQSLWYLTINPTLSVTLIPMHKASQSSWQLMYLTRSLGLVYRIFYVYIEHK